MLPFKENTQDGLVFIRTFEHNSESGDFTWHRDREDRLIKSIGITDWKIQLENELPRSLNSEIFIPMGIWHRVIKGTGDLKISLIKYPKQ